MFRSLNRFTKNRRHFLLASSATAVAAVQGTLSVGAESTPCLLRPQADRDLFRVRLKVEVEGNVNVPKNPLVSRTSDVKLPINSVGMFDYEERFHRKAGANATATVTTAERYYHEAQNKSVLNRSERSCELRDSVRETIIRREVMPEVVYGTEDYFDRDELELLRLPVSSVAIDQLLPVEPVQEGSQYTPTHETLVSVLNLTSVEASSVRADVVSMTKSEAKIHFRGNVDGSVEGVPTVIRLVGKLAFNRAEQVCTWLAMAIHETREIGKAEPGFDVVATVRCLRKPLEKTIALSPEPPQLDITGPIPQDRLYVDLKSDEIGIAALMDRRWRMMTDVPGASMMRMIDNDRSIAQCDFRPLPSLKPGTQWTLQAFQEDIQKTLGEQLNDLITADQSVGDAGLRVLRVRAAGAVEGVPIQWVLLHFSDDSGRRLLATFTMEGANVERFGGADLQLAGSLRLTKPAVAPQKTAEAGGSPHEEDRIADGKKQIEVQSASDRK